MSLSQALYNIYRASVRDIHVCGLYMCMWLLYSKCSMSCQFVCVLLFTLHQTADHWRHSCLVCRFVVLCFAKQYFFSSHYPWLVDVLTCQNEAATWALRLDLKRICNKKPDIHRLFKIALSQYKLNIHTWSWWCLRPFSHHMWEQCLFWCPF